MTNRLGAVGQTIAGYRLVDYLGGGGNADVWRAAGPSGEVALKLLRNRRPEPYGRFRREVEQLRLLNGTSGVLPLLDAFLPARPTRQIPVWLTMPIAEPMRRALGSDPSAEQIVSALAEIARTLTTLHERGVSHRDIKPDNLYRYEGIWAVGDFGLVDAPDVEPLTEGAQNVGPRLYLAPEMILDPASSDGAPADVYSLGKTMWVLLSGQAFPLPGEHSLNTSALGLTSYRTERRLSLLESLLESMTRHLPHLRPSMGRVATELWDWLTPAVEGAKPHIDLRALALRADRAVSRDRAEAERLALRGATADRVISNFSIAVTPVADSCVASGLPIFNQPYSHVPDLFNTDASAHLIEELNLFANRQMLGEDPPESRSRGFLLQAHERAPGLKLWIGVSSMPKVDPEVVLLAGAALVFWGGRRVRLWCEQERVVAGGASEPLAIDRLVKKMRSRLPDDVSTWVQEIEDRSDP